MKSQLTTLQKRYGAQHKKPSRNDLMAALIRWHRLLRTSCIQSELDKCAAGLGYQGTFQECAEITAMLVEAENPDPIKPKEIIYRHKTGFQPPFNGASLDNTVDHVLCDLNEVLWAIFGTGRRQRLDDCPKSAAEQYVKEGTWTAWVKCDRCGTEHQTDRSCGCFDNGSQ